MSYSFALVRGNSRSTVRFSVESFETDISFNFSWYYYRVFGKKGIESLYGLKGKDAAPIINKALDALEDIVERERKTKRVASRTWDCGARYSEADADADKCYVCAKNARLALMPLHEMCLAAPFFTVRAYAED